MNPSNLQHIDELQIILNELKKKGDLEGIILAFRDGRLIKENIGKDLDSKKLVSMCASVLESAVEIGETITNQKIDKIIAELAERSILIHECSQNTFFILLFNKDSNVSYVLGKLEEIIQTISKNF